MKIQILTLLLFSSLLTFAADYEKGTITKKDGTTVSGLVKYSTDNYLKFKLNKNEKATKYNSDDLSGFSIGRQKFVVLEKVSYTGPWIGKAKEDRIFVEVLIEGEICLYLYRFLTMQSGASYSMYATSTQFYTYKDEIYQVKGGSKKFRKQITQVLADYPELCSRINKEKMLKDDIERIVRYYNDKRDPKAGLNQIPF